VNRYRSPATLPDGYFEPVDDTTPERCEHCSALFEPAGDETTCDVCGPVCESCGDVAFDVESEGGHMLRPTDCGWWCSFCDARFKLEA